MELITKEDFSAFRLQLINEIKQLLVSNQKPVQEWLRSSEVRTLMKISSGTLQNLRVNGKLRSTNIGDIHYYRYADIKTLLETDNQ